jgi:hypothetical protein
LFTTAPVRGDEQLRLRVDALAGASQVGLLLVIEVTAESAQLSLVAEVRSLGLHTIAVVQHVHVARLDLDNAILRPEMKRA